MSDEAIRKRKERELKRQQKAMELRKLEQLAEDGTVAEVSQSVFAPVEEASLRPSTPSSSSAVYNISISAPSSSLNWYSPDSCAYSTVEAAKEAGIWDFPSNLHDRARYGVFKDLWEQGYFMGGGIRFGGDYLVYPGVYLVLHWELGLLTSIHPGDPLRYHSHFCATVIESPTQAIHAMEIVAHGRLGTATKKTHLFCGWDDEKKTVSYLSIEWAGFG